MQNLSFSKKQSWLSWTLRGILALGVFLLFGRLAELQVIKGAYFRDLAEKNRIKRIPIVAPRGEILARDGSHLTTNTSKEDDSKDEIVDKWQRSYPLGEIAGHITGYLGEVDEGEVGKVDAFCLEKGPRALGRLLGRGGLEEEYDCRLRGIDGEELVEVDAMGQKVRQLGYVEPRPGSSVQTTIDLALQKKVAKAMAGKLGVAIATSPRGEILAFYSSPSFDPSFFVEENKKTLSARSRLLVDQNLPLFNRGIAGTYHPGSIFKIVTAIAALEEKKIDESFTYQDTGRIEINDFSYANWYFTQYGGVEGELGLARALGRSTDTFFYKLGEFLGPDTLAYWANSFGLGEKTGIDLPGEVSGLVPTPAWKEKTKAERWFLGNTYHMAIGQGDLALTPLSVHRISMVMASGGNLCQPHFVLGEKESCRNLKINPKTLTEVKKGMIQACEEGGTAYPFFDFGEPKVACKTGTAETVNEDKTHAWFTIFANDLVLTILVENGGEGSKVAAPIAREILDYWFGKAEGQDGQSGDL